MAQQTVVGATVGLVGGLFVYDQYQKSLLRAAEAAANAELAAEGERIEKWAREQEERARANGGGGGDGLSWAGGVKNYSLLHVNRDRHAIWELLREARGGGW